MGPIRQPKKNVVASSIQEDKGKVCEAEHSSAVGDVIYDGVPGSAIPRVRLFGPDMHRGKDNIQNDQVRNEESLPTSRDDEEVVECGCAVFAAEHWRLDEPSVKLGAPGGRERQETKEGESDWDGDSGE